MDMLNTDMATILIFKVKVTVKVKLKVIGRGT